MLQLTPQAAVEINNLRPENLPEHTILRVVRSDRGREPRARLTFVAKVPEGDLVGESQGISMCVDQVLADQLSGKVLDVRSDGGIYLRAA
jgi:Fe-S cluster assembly iron-binding protein IscA